MDYIKTKDKIYEVKSYHDYDLSGRLYETTDGHSIDTIEVNNVGDTIDELCDEFIHCENKHCCVVGDVEAREMAAANYGTIYGAIWVFNGKGVPTLKPVAKMNEKGELELL